MEAQAGELLKGEGGDKLGGVLGHHDLYLAVLLDQGRGQRSGLVGGNAAGDAQKDGFSAEHCKSLLCIERRGAPLSFFSL